MPKVNMYDALTDGFVYEGVPIDGNMRRIDWLRLADACLDQAGLRPLDLPRRELIREIGHTEDEMRLDTNPPPPSSEPVMIAGDDDTSRVIGMANPDLSALAYLGGSK